MHNQYYEAVLQLRPRKKEIEIFIERFIENSKRGCISSIKVVRGGVDYYISSNKLGFALSKRIVIKYGGSLTYSKKIYGMNRKKGKVAYRSSILYRPLPVQVGDIISINEKLLKISSTGKDLIGRNIIDGKRKKFILTKGWTKLKKHTTQITKVNPVIEVTNPIDYQSEHLENSNILNKASVGMKVKVIVRNKKIFAICEE